MAHFQYSDRRSEQNAGHYDAGFVCSELATDIGTEEERHFILDPLASADACAWSIRF